MAEILAVTWEEEELTLRRVPSEGIWNKEAKPLKRVSLQRPTRAGRLAHPEVGGSLGNALEELLANVDVDVPCWLLLPNNWTLRFISDPPDMKSQDLTLNQLRWEAKQRISGDPADYKISAALLMGGARYFICVTRTEVIQRCITAAEEADLDLAGIGLEPNTNENYTFEHPLDLRDALPLEIEEQTKPFISKTKVSPGIVAIFLVVVVAVAGYLIFSAGDVSKPKPKKATEKSTSKSMTASEAALPPTEVSTAPSIADTTAKEVAPQPTSPAVTVAAGGAPARGLFASIPPNGNVRLFVFSGADIKAEVAGLASPDGWLASLRKQPGWSSAKIIETYTESGAQISAVRVEKSGWSVETGASTGNWQEAAKTSGLSVNGKTASGNLESALKLLDHLWKNPSGLAKVYLAPDGKNWQVVVQ